MLDVGTFLMLLLSPKYTMCLVAISIGFNTALTALAGILLLLGTTLSYFVIVSDYTLLYDLRQR
jgi:hypothetical protein